MITPFYFTKDSATNRGVFISINISDIHFGAMDPEYQFNTLYEQFIEQLYYIDFHCIKIIGDLFDQKFMSNHDAIMYAIRFIDECVKLCKYKNADLILLAGTRSHDAGQLKLFYHYLEDKELKLHIVEKISIITTNQGCRILCIPEEYDKGEEYYNEYLIRSGMYDECIIHGAYKGTVYGHNNIDLNFRYPIFGMSNFESCMGPIFAGHIHQAGCHDGYFHYCGSPYRWRFGEEEPKGYLVSLHDLDTHKHVVHFIQIDCKKYVTIDIDDLLLEDPKKAINYILELKKEIDFIRIKVRQSTYSDHSGVVELLKSYFNNHTTVSLLIEGKKASNQVLEEANKFIEENREYSFILDKTLSPYEILAKYINLRKGYIYTTPDEIINILSEEI